MSGPPKASTRVLQCRRVLHRDIPCEALDRRQEDKTISGHYLRHMRRLRLRFLLVGRRLLLRLMPCWNLLGMQFLHWLCGHGLV